MGIFGDPDSITQKALAILRIGDNFHLFVIFMLVAVLYIYFNEYKKGNWNVIVSGLTLYSIHWLAEILNAIFQALFGNALWTVPDGTAYLIFVGVGIELSLMFSIAGIVAAKMLPDDPKKKILGLHNRLVIGVGCAALAAIIEIFLIYTPTFYWAYWWWNALTVFIVVYIPFFVTATYAHDWRPKKQKTVILSLVAINVILVCIFVPLGWI